ncbi:B3 domain-containing protein Os06g0194400-like [Triticum dicoccoides]|uniref:B3 domain-containing protein Os06g0194400-like n=1 Tax=Triticum dicoccoides TaxID=85692 RepID=UPI00188E9B4E|nr:B3 domain-containing protein Os06g0194400-like [Triticum dicoccoides]
MAGAVAYEEQRRRQVEENRRKLDQLKLHHLSAALRDAAAAPRPSPAKSAKRKPRGPPPADAPPRRSGRVASLPEQPNYRFEDTYADIKKSIRGSRTHSTRTDLIDRVYATEEARTHATDKAEQLQAKLDPSHPSFVKPMTQSHVTGGFWLGLPKQFCTKHLPKRDEWITLVDEKGAESDSYYLARKWGLSAQWKAFAINHKLVDGDCLVFERIHQTRFKVHIFRQSSYYE